MPVENQDAALSSPCLKAGASSADSVKAQIEQSQEVADDTGLSHIDWCLAGGQPPANESAFENMVAEAPWDDTLQMGGKKKPVLMGCSPQGGCSLQMSEEEERSAVLRMRGGDSRARDALVTAHIGLVKHIAKTYKSHLIAYDDLVQEGTIGLIHAVDRFDPDRGCRLSSYAGLWIRSFLQRASIHARFIRIPDYLSKAIHAHKKEVRTRHGCTRHGQESKIPLHEAIGVSEERLKAAQHTSDWVQSMDTFTKDESGDFVSMDPMDEITPGPDVDCETHQMHAALYRVLGTLPPKQRDIVIARFGLHGRNEHTLDEVEQSYGISREATRQQQIRAFDAMRAGLAGWVGTLQGGTA